MFKKLLFLVSFIANAFFTLAQSHYPVQVQPTVVTPSIYLQDYVDQTNFRVKVSLNDLTKQNFKVRLKMTITGGTPSVVLKSTTGLPLTLNGGEVFFLSDGQLDTLFNPSDLGLTSTSVLTEGAYTFSFEATTDDINQLVVSNIGLDATNTLIVLNDPPLLNLPIKDTEIDMTSIGNSLQFGWMPRSFFTSPNRQVKYEIKIVALANPDDNPYQAIQSITDGTIGQNVYLVKDGLDIPLLNYDPSFFTLASGTVYAWQVRAYEEIVSSGIITKSGARFKNDGYSEVITFSTKDVCPTISMIAQSPNGSSPVRLEWNPSGTGIVNMYEIQYREYGTTLPYTIVRQTDNFLILDNTLIQEGLTYEYTVSVLCKKWQDPVFGGKFKLSVPNCAPPTPIKLGSDTQGNLVFLWDAPLNQTSITGYKFTYAKNTDPETTENLVNPTTTFTLPALSGTDFYNIQVDGVCDQVIATGKKQKVNVGDTDFVGTCPIPTPFNLIATRVDKTTTNEAKVVFTFSPLHQSYSLKYWENGTDSTKATVVAINSPTPETILSGIVDDQLYQYRVTFNCSASKISKSGIGMFKVEHASILDPNITPNTGNCFPPAHVAAEARTTTSAKFDWDKSTGADEYQVLYRVQGSTANFKIFTTTATNAKIDDLEDSKIYEYQIKCRCGIAYSIPSALGTVDLSKPSINANCDTVAFVTALKVTKSEVQMAWKFEDAPTRTSYTLYYKEDSQSWTDQYIQDFNDFTTLKKDNVSNDTVRFTVINLKPGTKYNFKLQATCGTDKAQANEVVSATTTAVPSECGSNKSCDRSSTTPIASLAPDEIIQIADYKIKIVAVEPIAGSNPQTYKGNGIAEAPFIGLSENIALQCSFDNLLVNDKACVLKGEVQMDSISAYALDEETRNKVKSYAAGAHAAAAQATDLLNKANDGLTTAEKYANMANDYAQGGGDVGKVKTGGFTADYTTTSTSAPTSNDALIQPAIVKNANNEIYQVDANGNVTKVGKFNDDYKNLQSNPITTVAGVTFKFTANSTAVYPYDAFQPGYNVATMKTHYLLMGTTFCDAKLILPKLLDKVNFTFTGGQSSNLKFVNRDGFEYDYDANAKTINLLGGPGSDAQEIMAVYTEGGVKKVIGAILLASYEPKAKKVILVKTKVSSTLQSAVTDAALQTELNKIYGKVGVTYTLTIDDSFINNIDWFGAPNQTTFNGGKNTSIGNAYQDDAKRMQEAYIAQKGAANLDKDAAYLFLVNKDPQSSTTDEALEGKMHLGNQFGFLYNTATLSAPTIAKTLAHELGHGNFVMYHIFDNIYLGDGAKTSDNLMAYGSSTTLSINKFQWDLIHDPGVNWGLFVNDDDQKLSQANAKNWFYSFLQIVKQKNMQSDITNANIIPFTSGEDYLNKIILLEDVIIGNKIYPYIVIDVPTVNSKVSAKVGRYTDKDPAQIGFDEYLTIGGFKITCLEDPEFGCAALGTSFYKKLNSWNLLDPLGRCVKSKSSDIIALADFLIKKEDNLLLFVNGYRENVFEDLNMNEDHANSDNKIRYIDNFPGSGPYWNERGIKFIDAIGTKNVVFADGHHKIYTSNHWVDGNVNGNFDDDDIHDSKIGFAKSMVGSTCAQNGDKAAMTAIVTKFIPYAGTVISSAAATCATCYHKNSCVNLDTKPNVKGYQYRYEKGKLAGADLWTKILNKEISLKLDANGKILGKIDIVAHSMGYAYAQGMIDYLKVHLPTGSKMGSFYILMPENACSSTTFDKNIFEEVWQYGTREDNAPLWEQDGVAPQCAVPGLNFGVSVGAKYGRIANDNSPDDKRNFTDSHTYFDWIFDRSSTLPGYVNKR